jgi:CRISPR-associated protein Cmr3
VKAQHVALIPRDGLFCKDGRGWHTSTSGRGHGLDWPWPSTVLGALRTAWGRVEEVRSGSHFNARDWRSQTAAIHLGRTLVLRRPHGGEWRAEQITWPVPRDALWLPGHSDVQRLEPLPSVATTLGRDDDEAREGLLWPVLDSAEKPLTSPRWWSNKDFSAWLAGRSVSVRGADGTRTLVRRFQARVGIQPETMTADDGVLFSHDVVETVERNGEWAIGVEVVLAEGDRLPAAATLGSDARLVRIEELHATLFEPSELVVGIFRAGSPGLRVIAVTPLHFERGWLPDGFEQRERSYRGHLPGLDAEVILRAAIVPRPVHISGWDIVAGAPKPTSRMVASGAVYFFERTDGQAFSEADARSLWLAPLGARTDEGFGRVVPGAWSPMRSPR